MKHVLPSRVLTIRFKITEYFIKNASLFAAHKRTISASSLVLLFSEELERSRDRENGPSRPTSYSQKSRVLQR